MPIYEFECDDCGKVFERLCFRGDDDETVPCESCGGTKTHKLMSTFSAGSSGSDAALGSSCAPTGGFS
jgi:putative FmdB family regulatory protein